MRSAILFLLLFPAIALSQEENKVSIYPNPATSEISIKIGEREDVALIKIISQNGTVVWSEYKDETEFKLSLEHFPEGTYIVQIGVLDKVEICRFVKGPVSRT